MKDVARELFRALRGSRSQAALSRRLGYRGNVVSDWEAGRRFPTAEETLRAAVTVGIDVDAAFVRFHPIVAPALRGGVAPWLEALRGSTTIAQVAANAGRSRFAVARWLSGAARPRLPDFLCMVEALTGRVSDLVAELVPIDEVPTLAPIHAARLASRRLASEEPWTEAVLRVIETGRASAAEISAALGLPLSDAARCLAMLEEAGVVRDGRVAGSLNVDTRAFPALRQHWAQVGLTRLQAPGGRDVFSYNVISASRADLERIEALHRAYFREVQRIVAASSPTEVVALINIQLVRFDPA